MRMNEGKTALREHLKNEILTLGLAPGAVLDEVELSGLFALSRTPAREVLRDLAGEGYLSLSQGRGARVAEMSHATLRDFFLVAPMIYEAILRLAAEERSDTQLVALRSAQEAFREALQDGSVVERTLANIRFHEVTGEMAGNVYLLPSFRRLLIDHARIGMTFYRPANASMSDKLPTASAQHDAIIEAIETRDPNAAAALAKEHWALSRSEIENYVMPNAVTAGLGQVEKEATA